MENQYKKCVEYWDTIFKKEGVKRTSGKETGNQVLDEGLAWITYDSETILDFGCGNGSILCLCALYGTRVHIGIDLSSKAIEKAKLKSEYMNTGEYQFFCGSIEELNHIEDETVDAVILFNIVDNLYPEDGEKLLSEVHRVLKKQGKVLIKLNPYLTKEQIKEWNIEVIKDNVLDDGLILWNNTTKDWEKIIGQYFGIKKKQNVYYEEYDQYNRLFWAEKD